MRTHLRPFIRRFSRSDRTQGVQRSLPHLDDTPSLYPVMAPPKRRNGLPFSPPITSPLERSALAVFPK
ncbi:hypothetical protein BTZ20_1516 [Rhodococcus sp. MTM3W5.2]|nr:hypothetical protein BTZ20_1516 [Rhodococcus sp. MTM3W5.2]